MVTPPLECGLLGGTKRAAMIADGRLVEDVILRQDIALESRLFLLNSVRGVSPAALVTVTTALIHP